MEHKELFIRTKDAETATILRELGLQEITETGADFYTFINAPISNFASFDRRKVNFTNVLCV